MAGRAKEYMDQNIGLTQSGFDRLGRDVPQYMNQQRVLGQRDRVLNWQQEDRDRALAEQNRDATDVEKYVGGELGKIIEEGKERVRRGEDPVAVATETKVKLHLAKQQEMQGGNLAGPTQVQMPMSAPSKHQQTLQTLGLRAPQQPQTLTAQGMSAPQQVQLPGYSVPGVDVGPRTQVAQPVETPSTPPQSSLLITRSPQAAQSGPPEIKTRKDYEAMVQGNEEMARWKRAGTGLTYAERQALEDTKQGGGNLRAGIRADTADKNRQAQMFMTKLNIDAKERTFWQSTSNIDNALKLLQAKFAFMERYGQSNELDKNLRAQLGVLARRAASNQQELLGLRDRLKVNQHDPGVAKRMSQLADEMWQINQMIDSVTDQMNPQGDDYPPPGTVGPPNQGKPGASTFDPNFDYSTGFFSEE